MLVQPFDDNADQFEAIARLVVERQYVIQPELEQRFGPAGRKKCFDDACFHLAYLFEACHQNRPEVFEAYIRWVRSVLLNLNVKDQHLKQHFDLLHNVLAQDSTINNKQRALEILDQVMSRLSTFKRDVPSYLDECVDLLPLAQSYLDAMLARDRKQAVSLVMNAVNENKTSIKDIYMRVFQPVQREIGRLWQMDKISVAQEHYCSAVTQFTMSHLYGRVFSTTQNGKKFVASCVGDELHEIGLRMVVDFLEMEGWDTIYLGANIPCHEIVECVRETKADAIGLSATLPFHVGRVREIIKVLRQDEETEKVHVIVGGYAFSDGGGEWQTTGADSFAQNAEEAIKVLEG